MADHTIRMSVPSQELDGRDVRFDVLIDGKKRGTLLVSEGGLDWAPRSAKTNVLTVTWDQFARYMEDG